MERWKLQILMILRPTNVATIEDIPEICSVLEHLSKENACTELGINFCNTDISLWFKAPSVMHSFYALWIVMAFYTKDLDCFNDIVNIFTFTNLFISTGSKSAVAKSRLGTSPDVNILTQYTDVVYPTKQRCMTTVIGWYGAAKMIYDRIKG